MEMIDKQIRRRLILVILLLMGTQFFTGCIPRSDKKLQTFTNPLLESGPDPWAFYKDGYYYYIKAQKAQNGNRALILMKTQDITALAEAEKKVIWEAPQGTDHSKNLWAPEIHFVQGAWYIYYAADDGNHHNHRLFVLENKNADPMTGKFVMKSRIVTYPNDDWAIDGSIFEHKGQLYLIWSGWEFPKVDVETARIYIAKMSNPWTVSSDRVQLSEPKYDWERNWATPVKRKPKNPIYVNEGPQILKHGKKMHIVYSCSGCWTPYYALGLLTADVNSDPMKPESWVKSPKPVFQQSPENGVYATGHNCFFKSPDGKEDWILYHANDNPDDGCGLKRSPRAQEIKWLKDDMPDFGIAMPTSQLITKPSGTPEL
jgi:GH43 family beta-xylosidase